MKNNQRDAFRIDDNGVLVPTNNGYKLVCYDDINNSIKAVYLLEDYDYNIHDNNENIPQILTYNERNNVNEERTKTILQNYSNLYQAVFKRFNRQSGRFIDITRKSNKNRKNSPNKSNGRRIAETTGQYQDRNLVAVHNINAPPERFLYGLFDSHNPPNHYLDKLSDTIVDFDEVSFSYHYNKSNRENGILFKKTFEDGTQITYDLYSNKKYRFTMVTTFLDSASYQKRSLPLR